MTLVIVPCDRSKIWKKKPHLVPVAAREAYAGPPFKVNRQYAEAVGHRWIILSGFNEPITPIVQYEVTFTRHGRSSTLTIKCLRTQNSPFCFGERPKAIAPPALLHAICDLEQEDPREFDRDINVHFYENFQVSSPGVEFASSFHVHECGLTHKFASCFYGNLRRVNYDCQRRPYSAALEGQGVEIVAYNAVPIGVSLKVVPFA
jgi:hypothetical protein